MKGLELGPVDSIQDLSFLIGDTATGGQFVGCAKTFVGINTGNNLVYKLYFLVDILRSTFALFQQKDNIAAIIVHFVIFKKNVTFTSIKIRFFPIRYKNIFTPLGGLKHGYFMNAELNKKKILVAPLDWGLGHTTRCIPIIYELLKQGADVVAAGNAVQLRLLEKEFPQITYQYLEGYNVHYAAKGNRFIVNLMKQAPGILKSIRHEHSWLKDLVKQQGVQGVISDNRFGLHHARIPTVFITHQLRIKNPLGGMMEQWSQRVNYRWIGKFSRCWIPDYPEAPGLAGALSHPGVMPAIPCTYLGPLSRMHPPGENGERKGLLILLSGPEPQRSLFEKIVCDQLRSLKEPAILVRGLPGGGGPPLPDLGPVPVYDHLPAEALNRLMCHAAYVVCRSGYSSLMDLQVTGARPILVPTPGQTEQEYLAALLGHQRRAVISSQAAFDLKALLHKAAAINDAVPVDHTDTALGQAVAGFLAGCGGAAADY